MEQIKDTLFYDGSFNGFLSLLYDVNARKLTLADIQKKNNQQEMLFIDSRFIPTELKKARSVWNSFRSKNYGALKLLYFAFLSEEQNIEWKLFQFYQRLNGNEGLEVNSKTISQNLHLEQLARLVEKEKWAIERRLSLDPCGENSSICSIQPKYNILPLISKFFRTRYKDQEWVIYDSLRGYGLHHKNGTLTFNSVPPKQLEPFLTKMTSGASRPNIFLKPDTTEQIATKKKAHKSHPIQAVA